MKVIILGGTGMIGRHLARNLAGAGYETIVLSRTPKTRRANLPSGVKLRKWDGVTTKGWGKLIDGAEAIINLAGNNLAGENFIPKRWTAKRKQNLIESRLLPGKAIFQAIQAAASHPSVFIQASAVGYYGTSLEQVFTEESPPGDDFLARLCVKWEASTKPVEDLGIRRAIIRSANVLDPSAGALSRLIFPFRLFVGGRLGSGRQWFPWIHPSDEVRAIRFLLEDTEAQGPFNLCAPNPIRNATFAKIAGQVLHRPSIFPVPAVLLKLALGEVASAALEGQRTIPKRLQNLGFTFNYPDFKPALGSVLIENR